MLTAGPLLKGETTPPVRLWHQLQAFDSASDCERARREWLASWAWLIADVKPEALPRDARNALSNAILALLNTGDASKIPAELRKPIADAVLKLRGEILCIASDDGRLK